MSSRTYFRQNRIQHRRRGYALISIMIVSMFATLFLFSLAGLSVLLLQTESATRQRNYAFSGAEAGLDFVLHKLNKALSESEVSDLLPSPGEPFRDYGVPVQYLPQLGNRYQVMVRISRISDSVLSTLQSKNMTSTIPFEINPLMYKSPEERSYIDDWRQYAVPDRKLSPGEENFWMVEVTSYCGVFASSLRSIVAIDFPHPEISSIQPTNSNDSFFRQGLTGNETVSLGADNGKGTIFFQDSSNPIITRETTEEDPNAFNSFRESVLSNGEVTLGKNSKLLGNLNISNANNAEDALGSRFLLSGDETSRVYGRLQSNAMTDSEGGQVLPTQLAYTEGEGTNAGASDVIRAEADQIAGTSSDRRVDNQFPLQFNPSGNLNQQTPNPVSVPQNTLPLPSFPMPSPSGDQTQAASDWTVPAGTSYTTYSFDSTGASGQLNFNEAGTGATMIFVQDDLAQSNKYSVNLDSGFITNGGDMNLGSPSNLQVFYAGTKPLLIKLSGQDDGKIDLSMLIYAPNAVVETVGTGNFKGSIVGKRVLVNHEGTMQFDPAAANVVSPRSSSLVGPAGADGFVRPTPNRYRMLTWQQLSGSLVPKE